jgi:catechol 2,3-dioxygenase
VSTGREYGIAPSGYRLPEATHLGAIRLQVSDLSRSIAYYSDFLGFTVGERDRHTARLHAAGQRDHTIEIHEVPGTTSSPRSGIFGLYHFAILLPSRVDLGRFIRHLNEAGVQFGAADHFVSEATYLWDPDGLGIEVYADRPRDAWRANGRELIMTTDHLDLESLVDAAGNERWQGMPPGTTLGHMHLSVADLEAARRFYHDALGLDLVVWSYPGALFLSAGGYHHHLGTNTWARGARRATDSDARLVEWELRLPSVQDVSAASDHLRATGHDVRDGVVTDPWGVALRLSPAYTGARQATE